VLLIVVQLQATAFCRLLSYSKCTSFEIWMTVLIHVRSKEMEKEKGFQTASLKSTLY